jgi:ribosomal protein S27E
LWDELDELDKKNLKGWKANVLTWNEMEKEQVQRNNGHGVPSYGSGDDDLKRAKARLYESLAETEEMERLEDLKQRRNEKHTKTETKENPYEKFFLELIAKTIINNKGESLGIKDTLELAKFLGGSNTKETLQLVDYIQHAQKEGQSITLSDISLKLEELKQTHDVEMAKLGFEEKKWEYQQEHSGDTMKAIENITKNLGNGVIGDAIKGIGQGAADRLRGQGGRIPMVDVVCPNCQNKFRANRDLAQVMCLNCGAMLQKPSEPQPQPIPEQPQNTEHPSPSETRNETVVTNIGDLNKKPEQKHPDVLENF